LTNKRASYGQVGLSTTTNSLILVEHRSNALLRSPALQSEGETIRS